jgi:hypothetical protein
VDVITLGSSHAHCAVLPMEMWRVAGVTALDVTGPSQPMPTTLAFLREALKTQDPQVVLLEVCLVDAPEPLSYRNKANFDTMPWGLPKIAGILNAAPVNQWEHLFVPLLSYHDRWTELQPGDFNPSKRRGLPFMRGALYLHDVEEVDEQPGRRNISEEGYVAGLPYVREIARLCGSRGIRLILFNAPPPHPALPSGEALMGRLAADLGTEFPDIDYLDMNDLRDVVGLDHASDFKDASHLNGSGATKVSVWLAHELQTAYGVPDRREEPLAERWNAALALYDAYVERARQ